MRERTYPKQESMRRPHRVRRFRRGNMEHRREWTVLSSNENNQPRRTAA